MSELRCEVSGESNFNSPTLIPQSALTSKGNSQGEKTRKVANTSKRGRNAAKGLIEIEPVVGARDFYPEEMQLRNWLFDNFRKVANTFCFQEYDTPILESAELYKRKAGEDITKQMYNFKDKDDNEVTLRPEVTPSLARMILKKQKTLMLPIKWFTIAQCWRFETIQLGRKREHYQWNMDIFGVKSVNCEAELLAAIISFFKNVGLTSKDIGIKVNSRKILQTVLESLRVSEENFAPVCVIVDKHDKFTSEQVNSELNSLGIGMDVINKITEILKIKDISQLESFLGAENEAVLEIKQLWEVAEGYGFTDWLVFDVTVVRGLAYYTGIVFEAFDRKGEFRAICGGGRYDKLMSVYGSKEIVPAAGFGMGDVVIVELLKSKGLIPPQNTFVDDIVVPFNESLRAAACKVASKLREIGRKVEIQLIPKKKIVWCYELADRIGAKRLYYIAPDEWSRNEVRIKNLRASQDDPEKEVNVPFENLLEYLEKQENVKD